jgi:hypothetical protein
MLTERERTLIERLGGCAGEYAKLAREAPEGRCVEHDINEFVAHVHDLQARVMWLAARREHDWLV